MRSLNTKSILVIFFATAIFRLIHIAIFPVTQDEAYYFYWAKFLDFGYFDHPPMMAWVSSLGNLFPSSVFASRFGGAVLTTLMFPVFLSLARVSGLTTTKAIITALLLSNLNLAALLLGIIQTPDLPLAAFWLLALHEAAYALKLDPKRWITAGLFTGLGLTSKYTMAIMGFVFLYGLWRKKGALLKPWPYLGGLACVIAFSPHIIWNYQHDWVTFRFQFGRGLKSEYNVDTNMGNKLPAALEAPQNSKEHTLAEAFKRPEKPKKKKAPRANWEKRLQGLSNFIGGQVALWGLLVFPILMGIRRKGHEEDLIDDNLRGLLLASALVPLIIFGLLSPFQKIEANWPAVYLFGASILLASRSIPWKALWFFGAANAALIAVLGFHANSPLKEHNPHKDRVLYETHGYETLASKLSDLDAPIFADTYQNISMLQFYNENLKVSQWPGITRPSEMIRRKEMVYSSFSDAKDRGEIFLLTSNRIPPRIPGFNIIDLWEYRDCVSGRFQIFPSTEDKYLQKSCKNAVHRWSVGRYQLSSSDVSTSSSGSVNPR